MIHIEGLIIILAVYINNENEKNYNILLDCFKQLKKVYPNEKIVAVYNQSPNNKWYDTLNSLDIEIIYNDSDEYKYEAGAYKCALNKYSADNYLLIQGNIYMNNKITEELDKYNPDVYALGSLYGLCWDQNGLNHINKKLNTLNMYNWNNEPLVLWNCFYCNHLCMKELIKTGYFNLTCNTKDCSCANERVLGTIFYRYFNNLKIKS